MTRAPNEYWLEQMGAGLQAGEELDRQIVDQPPLAFPNEARIPAPILVLPHHQPRPPWWRRLLGTRR